MPDLIVRTFRALETFGPLHFKKILAALLLRIKSLLKLHDIAWVIFHTPIYYMLGSLVSTAYAGKNIVEGTLEEQ
jgi:hypothetical protein